MIKNFADLGIGIFAYNRPSHLRRTLISLENNNIKQATIFLDGPKNYKDKVIQEEILFMIRNNPFIRLNLIKNKKNMGLAKSIYKGVNILAKMHKNTIIIEDDCVPRAEFFDFILKIIKSKSYKKNLNPICGYQFPEIQRLNKKKFYPIYLNYFIPWGWCISSEYWEQYKKFLTNKIKLKFEDKIVNKINKLVKNKNKKIWSKNFIKFNLINKKKIIFPSLSLIKNIGFDGSGINSKVTNKLNTEYIKPKNKLKNIDYIKNNTNLENEQKKILGNKAKYFF